MRVSQGAGRGPHGGGVRVAVRALVPRRAPVRDGGGGLRRAARLHSPSRFLYVSHSKTPRIGLNIVGILITVLQDLPEHADVVEKILFDDKNFNFMRLLEQSSDAFRMRVCILISLLCTFSCTAFSAAMESKWTRKETECLESLHTHCNVTLNRAARLATKELSNMPFYLS
ncbi:unnamed protein product [Euphydryas editha]|uniref:Uncharacterized protein n=1 Tax=Euphydryas editha TaxID=104508 RepID=A0AAU9TID2_EUPED|nr:unnamed protein product [Euphydryas editha]